VTRVARLAAQHHDHLLERDVLLDARVDLRFFAGAAWEAGAARRSRRGGEAARAGAQPVPRRGRAGRAMKTATARSAAAILILEFIACSLRSCRWANAS
jgi:hypothetical protein